MLCIHPSYLHIEVPQGWKSAFDGGIQTICSSRMATFCYSRCAGQPFQVYFQLHSQEQWDTFRLFTCLIFLQQTFATLFFHLIILSANTYCFFWDVVSQLANLGPIPYCDPEVVCTLLWIKASAKYLT